MATLENPGFKTSWFVALAMMIWMRSNMALHIDPPGEQRSWIFRDKGKQQEDVHADLIPCVSPQSISCCSENWSVTTRMALSR